MKSFLKLLLLIGVVFFGAVILPWLTQPKEVIPWRTDFAAARQEARQANKPVFAYFTASWCGPCQQMKRTVWADPATEAALRGYVPVKIDIDANQQLAQGYKVDSIPNLVVLNDDGGVRKQWTGSLTAEAFTDWLKK